MMNTSHYSIPLRMAYARPVYLQEVYGNHGSGDASSRNRKNYSHPIAPHTTGEGSTLTTPGGKTGSAERPTCSPPERPPKKPHLRTSSRENSPPPQTPPRGQTPTVPSRPPSRTSPSNGQVPGSAHSSRVSTPNLFRSTSSSSTSTANRMASRPKFPSPPASPTRGGNKANVNRRCPTDDLPLPPPPHTDMDSTSSADMTITEETIVQSETGSTNGKEGDDKPTLRIRDRELSHLSVAGGPSVGDRLLATSSGGGCHVGENHELHGREGKYRRTSSPASISSPPMGVATPTPPPKTAANPPPSTVSDKSPAKTPSRQSPATIAAKGAPGWEKFLGGKTSTVNFTSEEVEKFHKQQKQSSSSSQFPPLKKHSHPVMSATSQPPHAMPVLRPRTSANGLLETSFDGADNRLMVPASEDEPHCVSKPGAVPPGSMVSNLAKSTPSLFKSQSVNNNNNKPVCDKGETRKGLFKSSLESLQQRQSLHEAGSMSASGSDHGVNSPSRGTQQTPFHHTNPQQSSAMQPPSANSHHTQVHHHSHSNSDSGLSSLSGRTSTMSPISTMSTVSSVSSGSSSSRASLRSASIVSSCTIPLDEEAEEVRSSGSSPSGTIQTKIRQHYRHHKSKSLGGHPEQPVNPSSPPAGSGNPNLSFIVKKFSEESAVERQLARLLQELPVVKKQGSSLVVGSKSSFDYIANLFECQLCDEATATEGISNSERSTNSSLEELRSACSSGLEKWVARLRSESASLKAETKANEEVGRGVTVKVMQSAAPNECDKYKLHVEETDKITSLLLGLTARMARMENSIAATAATASQDQKDDLKLKKEKLVDQLEEAKKLRVNIDKKSATVSKILMKYLTPDQMADYKAFIGNKTRLIVLTRVNNDKMATATEQLRALQDTL